MTTIYPISIILPTYNERENLPIMIDLLHKTFKTLKVDGTVEIVVVDDSSPDNTLEVAQWLKKSYVDGVIEVNILSRKGKLGLGTAYIAGLKVAKGEKIIIMDADLSHHPKFIPQFLDTMENNGKGKVDIVCGTRYVNGGGVAGWDLRRKLTSRGANFLASFLLLSSPFGGTRISDLTGSFRLYERSMLEKVLPQVKCKGYAFQMEILVLAAKEGAKFAEVPITFVDRIYGESKLGANEIFMYLKGLLYLFFTT
mmetsp:Transcript_12916/g.19663  ORF Transcript_12916/g.19663 Transcript_12916/m.19663 type:complete len:254 (-) Transcript_12916:2138-2899(-)